MDKQRTLGRAAGVAAVVLMLIGALFFKGQHKYGFISPALFLGIAISVYLLSRHGNNENDRITNLYLAAHPRSQQLYSGGKLIGIIGLSLILIGGVFSVLAFEVFKLRFAKWDFTLLICLLSSVALGIGGGIYFAIVQYLVARRARVWKELNDRS